MVPPPLARRASRLKRPGFQGSESVTGSQRELQVRIGLQSDLSQVNRQVGPSDKEDVEAFQLVAGGCWMKTF